MRNTVIFFRDANKRFSYAYIFLAAFLMAVNALPFLKTDDALGLFAAFLLPSFAVYYVTNTIKKALAAGFCTAAGSVIYASFSEHYYSVLFAVIAAGLCVFLFSRVKWEYGFAALLIIHVCIAFGIGLLYPKLFELLKGFAALLKGKGALFGAVNNLYELFFSNSLGDLFYHKSYGGTAVNESGIISGAMSLTDSKSVSQYLTGKYFVNSFVTAGVFLYLYARLKGRVKSAFCFLCALAIIFGDVRLLSLFLLLYSPFLYVAYLFTVFAAYLVPSLLDLRIPFQTYGSLYELVQNGNQWLYFILTGIVLTALSYFLSRTAVAFYNPETEQYYPRKVRELLSALGGEENIEKLEENTLTVYNPNLVNLLKVDCDLRQNEVTLFEDDMVLLKKYL